MRNVPAGVVPLRYLRGFARMPYLAVGDGFLRIYRHGFREPWTIPASEVVAAAADTRLPGLEVPELLTSNRRPNLRLVFARPMRTPPLRWWVAKPDELVPADSVDGVDVTVRDVGAAAATLAAGGVAWTDDALGWRMGHGDGTTAASMPRPSRPWTRVSDALGFAGAAGGLAVATWVDEGWGIGIVLVALAGSFATRWRAGHGRR